MLPIFLTGIITLFIFTAIFYIVFFVFVHYWHLKKITFVVVPAIFTFEFFSVGFLIVCATTIILNYLPYIINTLGI